MLVRMVRLRECGKRLSDRDVANARAIEGELSTTHLLHPRGVAYTEARVSYHHSGGKIDTLAVLYEPRLVSFHREFIFLDGLEKLATGETVFQQWRCELFR